jgi:imidazole glycerol-phosphate synthase subunit HisF
MLRPRLIAALLVDAQLHLVKTIAFEHRQYLGDPLNAAYVFSGFEVDELLVLDIDATPLGRQIPTNFVAALARFTRVPLTIGGGVNSLEQIHDLLALGVEKVALSSVLTQDFAFLKQAVDRFGSSTISVVLNVQCMGGELPFAWFGRPIPGTKGLPLRETSLACEQAGAGELVLNFVDRDGARSGFDVPLLTTLNETLKIPLVALGGCGSQAHISELLANTPLSGVAAGSMFVYAPGSNEVLLNYGHTSSWLSAHLPHLIGVSR